MTAKKNSYSKDKTRMTTSKNIQLTNNTSLQTESFKVIRKNNLV